ncbi:hypothetical protein AB0M34_10185 [Nocardia sp. NPDC050193]
MAETSRRPPSFVVGERAEDDSTLARNLLASILAAVTRSASGVEWAVAVMRTPVGPIVLLTSTEGRGWLPAGLYLPAEVTVPWRWEGVLDNTSRAAVAALEGTADPARILAEFGAVGRLRSARITAVASSTTIDDHLREILGADVAVEDRVSAAESEVDLTAPGPGLVDRLAVAGSAEALQRAATVPEGGLRAECVRLARMADAHIRSLPAGVGEQTQGHRAQRSRILDALEGGGAVPATWWNELQAERPVVMAESMGRTDMGYGPRGPVDAGAPALRRRAEEMLFLLGAGQPDRQTLRDMLYTYGQIAEHPVLLSAPRVSTSAGVESVPFAGIDTAGRARNDTSSAPTVSAPDAAPSTSGLLGSPDGPEGYRERRRA